MSRLWLLIILSLFGQMSFGQTDFCLPGATWVYTDTYPLPAYEFERKVVYVGDTIIAPYQDVKILDNYRWQRTIDNTYQTKSTDFLVHENDSVFKLVDNQWELIFDFNVDVGDKRLVYMAGNYVARMIPC